MSSCPLSFLGLNLTEQSFLFLEVSLYADGTVWLALGMPPVLACVACSVLTDSQEDFTAHGRQIFWMWYPTVCEANGAVSRFSGYSTKSGLDNALRAVVGALVLSCVGPGVGISWSLSPQDVLWLHGAWINKSSCRILTFEIRLKTERNACGTLDLLDPGNTRSGPDPKDVWGNSTFSFSRTELIPQIMGGHCLFGSVRVRQSGRLPNICLGDYTAFLAEQAVWLLVIRIMT